MVTVDYMVLADAAAVAEGKHYIHGAGWDRLFGTAYPVTHPQMTVAVRLAVPWLEANRTIQLEVDVVDANEQSIVPTPLQGQLVVGRPPHAEEGADLYMPLALNLLSLQFPHPGTYAVVVRIDKLEAKRTRLHVSVPPGMALQPPSA